MQEHFKLLSLNLLTCLAGVLPFIWKLIFVYIGCIICSAKSIEELDRGPWPLLFTIIYKILEVKIKIFHPKSWKYFCEFTCHMGLTFENFHWCIMDCWLVSFCILEWPRITDLNYLLLARRDNCPESYCHDSSVSVGVTPQGKNFNLGYIFWTIRDRILIFHI
jgi:hypothetical protein